MKRNIANALDSWVDSPVRQPLLLRGARQVGKTFSLLELGKKRFQHTLYINFEERPELSRLFDTFDPRTIMDKASLLTGVPVIPGKTFLVLDEIQECPRAITALRYFQEKMPDLAVAGAGSLIEFALRSEGFHMPVGRVQSLWMFPLTFAEFLTAGGQESLREHLHGISPWPEVPGNNLDLLLHQELHKQLGLYLHLGGMPRVVKAYVEGAPLLDIQSLQTGLLQTFRQDFGKYSSIAKHKYLQEVFVTAPRMVGQRYKFAHVNAHVPSRDLKEALFTLSAAQCITIVRHSGGHGAPLSAEVNDKKFKILFLDVGLMQRALGRDIPGSDAPLLAPVHAGPLAEQFVGQELLAYGSPWEEPGAYFWARDEKNSSAEVDYLLQKGETVFPVEVKSGKTGTLKSLGQFLKEHPKSPWGFRFSHHSPSFHDKVLSWPLFMIEEWPRLGQMQTKNPLN
jgi:predicted AAA+ superfamily ATPase